MKLNKLRGAIRKPGNPSMIIDLGNGVPMTLAFQKTPLLEELGRVFGDDGSAETGLSYDPETNMLTLSGVKDITESERARIEAENFDASEPEENEIESLVSDDEDLL